MTDWKNTRYGVPKTWAQQQREKREAELEKVSASPFWPLVGIAILGIFTVSSLLYVIGSLLLR